MKILTKLKIFGIFATILLIALGVTTYWRASQVGLAIERNKVASEIVKEAFMLNILSGDYIQTYGERAETQWIAQQKHLLKTIYSYDIGGREEHRIIEDLKHVQGALDLHFSQLRGKVKGDLMDNTNVKQNQASQAAIKVSEDREKRLAAQLSLDTQNIVSFASKLADINSKRLSGIRETTYSFLISIITILGITLIFTYFLLARSISGSIRRLIEGTKVLAGGDLSFRYKIKNRDEFGQLSLAFNDMAANLQKLDEIKTEFIFLVSHELRTPVGAIKGFMSMINSGDYGDRTKKLERPLYLITASVDRLLRIVNKMLDVSRIQAGKVLLNFTDFNIHDLIDESVSSMKPLADEKDIKLVVKKSDSFIVHADRDKTREVIINLIENAIKFTEKGSITVFSEHKDDKIVTFISDTGIGIAEEYQQKLFDRFDEIKLKHAGKTPGIGLGLYISREFARKMGGDLWIGKSSIGNGSIFAFSLPIANNKVSKYTAKAE